MNAKTLVDLGGTRARVIEARHSIKVAIDLVDTLAKYEGLAGTEKLREALRAAEIGADDALFELNDMLGGVLE